MLAPEGELPVSLGVGQVAEHVGHGQALRARPLALAAHRAVVRPDLLPPGDELLRVQGRPGLRHRAQVLVELGHVGRAGDRGVDERVPERPLEGGEQPAARRELLARGHRLGPAPTRHHLHGHDADAGVVERLHEGVVALAHREVVGHEDDVHILLDGSGDDLGVASVAAHPGEADLPLLLRQPLRVEELVADLGRGLLAMEVPDVDVVGADLPEALLEVREGLLLRRPARLRGDEDLVPAPLEGRPHEPLVVAALVAAGGVEEVHAEIGGPLDDALVRGDHATEGDLGDLESRLAERALADDGQGGGRGGRHRRRRRLGSVERGVGRGGQREAAERGSRQELTARAGAGHGDTPPISSNRANCGPRGREPTMDRSL